MDLRTGIMSAANALGINPVDLATAISYETGGTFNPTQGGPHTQWGQHRGLIQFGEPQAKKYNVDWSNPIDSQLGPSGAVVAYLRDTGVRPGMGLMDVYSAINAGHVGRNNASDANNGGAPGTVADKVNNQMSAHRQKAEQLFQGPDGPKGQESYPVPGSMAPPATTGAAPFSLPPGVARFAADAPKQKKGMGQIGKFGGNLDFARVEGGGADARPTGDTLLKFMQNPQALAQMLLKQRMGG